MLLRLWQNLQLAQDTLADYNTYRMYSNIVTEGRPTALTRDAID